jgi:hypothetical protein
MRQGGDPIRRTRPQRSARIGGDPPRHVLRSRREIRMPLARNDANTFDGVMVFSATLRRSREELGDRITEWLNAHPELVVVDTVVVLSSSRRFHCQTIAIFWRWG